jgi:hypothetical protein
VEFVPVEALAKGPFLAETGKVTIGQDCIVVVL